MYLLLFSSSSSSLHSTSSSQIADSRVMKFVDDAWQYITDSDFSKTEQPTTINAIKSMALCVKLKLKEISVKRKVNVFDILSERIPVSNTKNFSSASLTPVLSAVRFLAELIDQLKKVELLQLDSEELSILSDIKAHTHWTHHLDVMRMKGFPHYEVIRSPLFPPLPPPPSISSFDSHQFRFRFFPFLFLSSPSLLRSFSACASLLPSLILLA